MTVYVLTKADKERCLDIEAWPFRTITGAMRKAQGESAHPLTWASGANASDRMVADDDEHEYDIQKCTLGEE